VLVFLTRGCEVGAETENAVGEKMKQIAAKSQVCWHHASAQVAAPAERDYVVTKQGDGRGRTNDSENQTADRENAVTELARCSGRQERGGAEACGGVVK